MVARCFFFEIILAHSHHSPLLWICWEVKTKGGCSSIKLLLCMHTKQGYVCCLRYPARDTYLLDNYAANSSCNDLNDSLAFTSSSISNYASITQTKTHAHTHTRKTQHIPAHKRTFVPRVPFRTHVHTSAPRHSALE